jgi:serine/threonine protein kinase
MSEKRKKSADSKNDKAVSKTVPTPECLKSKGYQIHEQLGEGAYSVVYRATNSKSEGVNRTRPTC